MSLVVKFRGVRGSFPVCSSSHLRFGGNTSCVEIHCDDDVILLDAGTGIMAAGAVLQAHHTREVHILLSHAHWDHIQGFPLFQPGYDENSHLVVMAAHLKPFGGLEKILAEQMQDPFFPVPISSLKAKKTFTDFDCGDKFTLHKEVKISTTKLNHPNEATGYRIDYKGNSVCYITDTEHVPGKPDQNILNLVEGCDLMIYDGMYTDDNFKDHIGWGHSTWQEGIRLCKMANVKSLALFHHDPTNNDDKLDDLDAEIRKAWPKAFLSREDMAVSLNGS